MSVFETTIRILGGLLSAYQLSGDRVFLDKCARHPSAHPGRRTASFCRRTSSVSYGQGAAELRQACALDGGFLNKVFDFGREQSGEPPGYLSTLHRLMSMGVTVL